MTIVAAEGTDLPAVRRLLESQSLPLDAIDECVATMVVAKDGGEVVGAAGVELYAEGALLRSVVVHPSVQGLGLGAAVGGIRLGRRGRTRRHHGVSPHHDG